MAKTIQELRLKAHKIIRDIEDGVMAEIKKSHLLMVDNHIPAGAKLY